MATLLLTEQPDTRFVRFQRSRARERLCVRLGARQLDVALANGVSPDSSPALSLHAHALISATTRRELSRAIRNLLRAAERPHQPCDPRVPICRRKVLQAKNALEELADYLLADGPVDARGVAQVRLLLRDGSGPLFTRPQADDLRHSLRAAFEALELCV
jgi:hypothetical protein